MDLIGMLSGQLGISEDKAKALAGSSLGALKGFVQEEDEQPGQGQAAAAEIDEAVPELGAWQAKASELGASPQGGITGALGGLLGGDSPLGDLLGGAIGEDNAAQAKDMLALAGTLEALNLSPGMASKVAPMLLSFLQSRLSPATLGVVMQAAPFLTKIAQERFNKGGEDLAQTQGAPTAEDDGFGLDDVISIGSSFFGKK